MSEITALLQILDFHRGRSAAISADALLENMRRYGCDVPGMPALRGLVHDARQAGHLITSCDDGYFLPTNLNEAMENIDMRFIVPGRDLLRTARILRRVARQQFGGQLRLIP